MPDLDKLRVPPEELRLLHDPASFAFECTDELAPLSEFVGQDRAVRSLQFGLELEKPGYNIFVTGLTGTGKATAILEYIQRTVEARREAGELAPPDDWCYVYNFDDPDRPDALRLPPGLGRKLRDHLEELLASVRSSVTRAFASEDYEQRKREILDAGQHEAQRLMEQAQKQAEEAGFRLRFSPVGVALVPIVEGKPVTAEQFAQLEAPQREEIEARQQDVMRAVADSGERLRAIEKDGSQRLRQLDRQVGETAVEGLFASVIAQNGEHLQLAAFLEHLREFTVSNVDLFRETEGQPIPALALAAAAQPDPFIGFRCNVLVDNSQASGPPIIVEPNPTWTNLFGKIERRAQLGTYVSDHMMLKPGAFQRANGGYIILNLVDVLLKPGSWDGLKRAIRTKEVRLEDPMEQYGLLTPQALRPEPIPVDVKVIDF